jgi:hypothetical protein
MRVPQMTTRRWIAAVAISATLLGVIVEINRELKLASQYRLEAKMHGLLESASNGTVFRGTGAAAGMYAHGTANPELAVYHAEMRRKYENAAARPWIAIEPDPLPPRAR